MKKLISILLLLFVGKFLIAQTNPCIEIMPNSTGKFSFMIDRQSLSQEAISLNEKSPNKNAKPSALCMNLNRNLTHQHYGSLKSASLARSNDNPYKARNIGIGFLIGGAINAGAGAYYIYSFESDPAYWDIDIFFAEIVGAGAIVIGGASIIGGTIATIIGSIHGYKYAHSNLKFKSDGKSFGLAYNF